MPYCIVLTKEGSSHLISLVPSTWVKDNVLFWPRSRKNSDLEQLRRDENSMPAENWKKISCKMKVNGIHTFAEGLKLEDLYSNFEDTEDEDRYYKNRELNKNHPTFKYVTDDLLDLNASFELCMENQKVITEKNNKMTEKKERDNDLDNEKITKNNDFEENEIKNYIMTENIINDVTKLTTEEENMNPDAVPEHDDANFVTLKLDHMNEIISENSALSTENKILKESIQRFQNLEQETRRGFAVMQIQLDKIFDFLKTKSFSNNDETAIDDVITQEKIEFPINSIQQLNCLENELANEDFLKALVKKFSKVSGTSGTHKIQKIGLQVTKSFFTDELLSHFTWKGIKGCSKPPFMPYINIRNCFYKIVHLADNSCTALEADSFLQNSAIKHSAQRIKRKSSEMNISKSKKKRTETYISEADAENKTENTNTIDDDKRGTTKPFIKESEIVTVLSDVKITNKIMDLKNETKMTNISYDDLTIFQHFNENEQQ